VGFVGRLEVTKVAFGVLQWTRSIKCLKKPENCAVAPKNAVDEYVAHADNALRRLSADAEGVEAAPSSIRVPSIAPSQ
jgi:hypothetical protein